MNTPSGGAPPAPHFAMCRSGHTEARNEFRFFLKIGMYVLRVSFGPVLYCCLLGSNWRLGDIIFWICSTPGPSRKQSCKKSQSREKNTLSFGSNIGIFFVTFSIFCCSFLCVVLEVAIFQDFPSFVSFRESQGVSFLLHF